MEAIYTIKEVAELLKVTHVTIRKEIKTGRLKSSKVGGQYRITQKQVDEYLSRVPKI